MSRLDGPDDPVDPVSPQEPQNLPAEVQDDRDKALAPSGTRTGVLVGAMVGVTAVGVGLFFAFGIQWGLMLGVPFALGLALSSLGGPSFKRFGIGAGLVASLPVIIGAVMSAAKADGIGIFCGLMAAALLIPGYLLGFGVGAAAHKLEDKKKLALSSPWRVWWPCPALIALPLLVQLSQRVADLPVETVRVEAKRLIDAPPEVVWDSPTFSGERTPKARAPFALGMTRPQSARGEAGDVGDIKTYQFRDGHLTIRVTETVEARALRFQVIEQVHVEDRAARFLGGWMRFDAADAQTEARFGVVYQPLMTPRWLWEPAERWAATAVLDEVLERMEDSAQRARRSPVALGDKR